MTFVDRSKIYTPMLCRMMARRRGGRPFSQVEIADRSGLTPAMVEAVTFSKSWDEVPFATMLAFLNGCDMDFTNWKACHRMDEYIKSKPQFTHLIRSPDYATYWLPLMVKWRKGYGLVTPASPYWAPLRRLLMRLTPLTK